MSMTPSIKYIKASNGSGNANTATVTLARTAPATTINVDTTTGFPAFFCGTMGTPHTFNDPVTGEEITVISEATAVDFSGHVDGSNLEIDDIAPGYTDAGSEVGDIVIIRPTTQWGDNVAAVLEIPFEDDGDLKKNAPINSPQGTLANVTPVGSILDFAGTAAPTGWLLCYGQTLDATVNTEYADLYTVIGNTYGGTDNTDFVVPDLRGRVVAGQDDMGGSSANRLTNQSGGVDGDVLGDTGGSQTHTLTTAELAAHSHTRPTADAYFIYDNVGAPNSLAGGATYGMTTSTTTGVAGSGDAHNNVQPTIILNKIIKY